MSGNRNRRAVGPRGSADPTGRPTDRARPETPLDRGRPTGGRREPTGGREYAQDRERAHDGDRGSATIWTVGGIAVLALVAAVIVEVGAATVARHRAESAADLAALAAAEYSTDGQSAACDRARWVANGMRVRVDRCWLRGWDALVEVSAPPAGLLTSFGPARARAMAGPANPVDGQTTP